MPVVDVGSSQRFTKDCGCCQVARSPARRCSTGSAAACASAACPRTESCRGTDSKGDIHRGAPLLVFHVELCATLGEVPDDGVLSALSRQVEACLTVRINGVE